MKKVIIITSIIFILFSVYAVEIEDIFELNKPRTINGKTITMKLIGDGEVFIKIDKSEGWFKEGQRTVSEGITIIVKSIAYKSNKAWLNVSVPFNCGDGSCSANESEGYCCKDCGCVSSSFVCLENQCVLESRNKCAIENQTKDCDDNNTCTIDTCLGIPRACFNEPVECKNNDKCCSSKCDYKTDNDCPPPPKCAKENETLECDDKNSCTRDYCDIECKHEEIGKCIDGGFCFKVGEVRETQDTVKQCSESGEWVYGEENIVVEEEQGFLAKRLSSLKKINLKLALPIVIAIVAVLGIILFFYIKSHRENFELMQKRIGVIKEQIAIESMK